MRKTLAALTGAALLVTGCSGGVEKTAAESIPTLTTAPVPSPAFTCEPLGEGARAWFDELWGNPGPEPVQVRVGEGKRAGEIWYVVLHGDRQVLTNAPGPSGGEDWFDLSDGWGKINWDAGRIRRGQAALAEAVTCQQETTAQARRDSEAVRLNPTPDPAVMATMTCKPVSKDLLSTLRFGPTPTRSIQVEVGEGLAPGSKWWVVILDLPHDDLKGWPPRTLRFLTDAPGATLERGPDGALEAAGRWIPILDEDPWGNVEWDAERLTRAHSALIKAQECLAR